MTQTTAPLSPGFKMRAVGRDFDSVVEAEAHAHKYMEEEDTTVRSVNLFLVGPAGVAPSLMWAVLRRRVATR